MATLPTDFLLACALTGAVVTGVAGGIAHARRHNRGGGSAAVAALWYALIGMVALPVLGVVAMLGVVALGELVERQSGG